MSNDLVVSELKGREVARLDRLAEQARAFIEAAKAGNGEQQQPGGAESNMLILWRQGCIHSKIDPEKHWALRAGRLASIVGLRRSS